MTNAPQLTRADAEAHVRAWIDRARDACERGFADTGFFHFTPAEVAAARAYVPPDLAAKPTLSNADLVRIEEERTQHEEDMLGLDRLMSIAVVEGVADDLKTEIAQDLSRGGRPRPEWAEAVENVMADVAPSLDRMSVDGKVFARTLLRGFATLIDERVTLMRGDPIAIPSAAQLPPPAPLERTPKLAFLADWEVFSADKVEKKAWKPETALAARASRSLFEQLVPGATTLTLGSRPIKLLA